MVQKEFREIAFEYAKEVSSLDNVLFLFLFGSVAREEADKRSDIDFCIITNNEDMKNISSLALDLEKKYDKNIQLVISKNFTGLDSFFISNLLKEGILLYAKNPIIKLKNIKCEEFVLFSFSLSNLPQSEKMKMKRILYGYETKKKQGNKIYKSKSKGIVEELNGFSVGRGSVLIPVKNSKYIENILNEKKAEFKKIQLFKPLI